MKKLMSVLDLSRIGVYKRIENAKQDYSILETDIAAYCLAFKSGIKIDRYGLKPDTLYRVQQSLSSGSGTVVVNERKTTGKGKGKAIKSGDAIINIGVMGKIDHPVITRQIATEAQKMANVYPIIYVFENSIRKLIQKIMEPKYGPDWWNKAKIVSKVKEKVKIRKKDEDKNRWHGKRGAHEIFYTDIEELTSIMENNWDDFKKYLPKQYWVKTIIEIIGTSRNVVAHNNPLTNDDISALKVHFKQWTKQIKNIKPS